MATRPAQGDPGPWGTLLNEWLDVAHETDGNVTRIKRSVAQAAHGLVVGDAIRLSGSSYVKAQANSATNALAVGLVDTVEDADNFTLVLEGHMDGLAGLSAGTLYFLSPSSAGTLTATEPTTAGQVSKPMLLATAADAGYVLQNRGNVLGSGAAAPLASVLSAGNSAAGLEITNLAAPSAASSAATKAYADALGGGGGSNLVDDGAGAINLDTTRAEGEMRVMFIPNQTDFPGSIFFGSSGGELLSLTPSDPSGHMGRYNTAFGIDALLVDTTGNSNNAFGYRAMAANVDGTDNCAIGREALSSNTSGTYNTAVGQRSMNLNVTGSQNTAIGFRTLMGANPQNSVAIGYGALQGAGSGSTGNVGVGWSALNAVSNGDQNVGVGNASLINVTTGLNNVAMGTHSLRSMITTSNNVGIGFETGYDPAGVLVNATVSGTRNTFVGTQTGAADSSDPSDVTVLGYRAVAGASGTAIGSGASAGGSGSTALGKGVSTTVANQIAIGTSAEHILLKTAAPPADASLAASQFTIWLDATAGAAKLMVKAKNASGTVVTGSVNLV